MRSSQINPLTASFLWIFPCQYASFEKYNFIDMLKNEGVNLYTMLN